MLPKCFLHSVLLDLASNTPLARICTIVPFYGVHQVLITSTKCTIAGRNLQQHPTLRKYTVLHPNLDTRESRLIFKPHFYQPIPQNNKQIEVWNSSDPDSFLSDRRPADWRNCLIPSQTTQTRTLMVTTFYSTIRTLVNRRPSWCNFRTSRSRFHFLRPVAT